MVLNILTREFFIACSSTDISMSDELIGLNRLSLVARLLTSISIVISVYVVFVSTRGC